MTTGGSLQAGGDKNWWKVMVITISRTSTCTQSDKVWEKPVSILIAQQFVCRTL